MKTGDRIGDWIIEKSLGAGGMGSVFLCRSVLSTRVRAALKVLRANDGLATRERFIREVDTLARLDHPAIVRVLSGGDEPNHQILYLFMEYVEGEDLANRLKRGPLSAEETYHLMHQVVSGLAHAHARGVTHRDIKPANIMLCSDGSARIVDFGIASTEGLTGLTQDGNVPGTMPYVDPAVFEGAEPNPVKGDLYATGLVLYECLTGKQAFPEDGSLSSGQRLASMTGRKLKTMAMDPGPDFPAELRALVQSATEPNINDRLSTMDTFLKQLTLRFESIEGVQPFTPPPTRTSHSAPGKTGKTIAIGDSSNIPPPPRSKKRILGLLGLAGCGCLALIIVVLVVLGAGFGVLKKVEMDLAERERLMKQLRADQIESRKAAEEMLGNPTQGLDESPKAKPIESIQEPAAPDRAEKPIHPKPVTKSKPKAERALKNIRVRLLHRRGQISLAQKAERLLEHAGARVEVKRGEEGGTWEPFWGHVYYFRDDLSDEAAHTTKMLSKLGYLSAKTNGKNDQIDLVVWLQKNP